MNPTIFTKNDFHLGDNLILLHLLRALAKQRPGQRFVHFCHACHHVQLQEVVDDLPEIILQSFESPYWEKHHKDAIDTWKNSDGAWESSPLRWDWSAYTLWHHGAIARKLGFEPPFTCREHLLLDYPALEQPIYALHSNTETRDSGWPFDFLIGDSAPGSGQYGEWADHSANPLVGLVDALRSVGKRVICTSERKEKGSSISFIGGLSTSCQHHIMVPNGPFFPTMNTKNHHFHGGRKRIIFLSNGENLNMPFINQCSCVEEVFEIAKGEKWF